MGKGTTPAIKLVFDTGVRSPGDVVEGEVELYFPALVADNIDEVILKLRGAIITCVPSCIGIFIPTDCSI